MGFVVGLIVGLVAGVTFGGDSARKKRMRQVAAALKEGRIKLEDNAGKTLEASDLNHLLDDEFRDA